MLATNDYLIKELVDQVDFYKISSIGQVWKRGIVGGYWDGTYILLNSIDKKSDKAQYQIVKYKGKALAVHRIVYLHFYGILDKTMVIDHVDGDHTNNRPKNLEMVTVAENNRRRYLTNPKVRYKVKLDWEKVKEIRTLAKEGLNTTQILAKVGEAFGITARTTIRDVVNYKTWK